MERSKILFVDDEPNVTAAMRRSLRGEPFDVFTAASAAEALELLEQQDVDVVISDERMPGIPGSVFLAEVRQKYPETVRIILSGQANLEDIVRAINEGEIYRFFIKPFNAADLAVTIRQALEHKQLIKQSRMLLREYQKQASLIEKQANVIAGLEGATPSLTHVETDAEGAILLEEDDNTDVATLLADIERELDRATSR